MKQTTNFKLNKPDYTDVADIADINANMDIIDSELKSQQDSSEAHTNNTSNPHNVTKAQLGLANVNNTADKDKNVLSATKLTTTSLTNESLNSVTEVGDYWGAEGNTVTDFPTGASSTTTVDSFTLIVNQFGNSLRLQTFINNKGMWIRTKNGSNWNGWIKVYNSANPVKINEVTFNGAADITILSNPKQNTLTNESLSSITSCGFYYAAGGNTVTDFPRGASSDGTKVGGFSIIVIQAGGAGRLQIYISDKGMWYRVSSSMSGTTATWNGWIKVYSSINANTIPYYSYSKKIADGLDVYSISSISSNNITLDVNKNYSVGDSFGLVINSDSSVGEDVTLSLIYNGDTIRSGIIDDADGNSLSDFEGGVLYKVTLKSNSSGLYRCEKSEANTVVNLETDRTLNYNNVFFVNFTNTSGTINDGIQLQTTYNGTTSTAMYLYDTGSKKITSVETNRMYLFIQKSNGYYMMKIG